MHKHWLMALVAAGLLLGATGCPGIDVDENEVGTAGPQVEFDPAARIIPFPNNLLIDPMTGLVNLPAQCNESATAKALREQVLNQLDGFGTFEVAITVTFTEPVDEASLQDRVVLFQRTAGANAIDPAAAQEVPVIVRRTQTTRFAPDCATSSMVEQVAIIPLVPLEQKSNYTVALLKGIKTATGEEFGQSFTWALISQANPPVVLDDQGNVIVNRTPLSPVNPVDENMNGISDDLESLRGIALLWQAHAQAVAFLVEKGIPRSDILLAWEFKTQTTTDPLDPAVAGSPAANVYKNPATQIGSLTATINRTAAPYVLCDPAGGGPGTDNNTQCFLKIALGAASGAPTNQIYATGNATCAAVGCAAVGDVLGGKFNSKQYQIETPNPFDPSKPIPGPWNNPRTPTVVKDEAIDFIAIVPASPAPANGYPTVVFGHGLGSSKKTIFAIGPQLSAPQAAFGFTSGFITIAIDFVGHDSRAVRISSDAAIGCDGTPDPTVKPQCFAPFLSPNLATTRDGIRQSVLDVHGLVEMLKACGNTTCATAATGAGNFHVDPAHISYLGISLGGIMGSTAVASKTDIKTGLLNVPGVGWVDILENTQTLAIRCSLVDGLIDAGILVGDKSTGQNPLCFGDTWKTQPGYRQFAAIGRWVLDPADPANFTQRLAARRFFIQEVVGDTVVPNLTTENEGALTGVLGSAFAGACTPQSGTALPTPEVLSMPMTNKFARYMSTTTPGPCNNAENTNPGTPGQVFVHSSLLRPAPGHCVSMPMNTCTSTNQATGDAQCTAANGGTADTCDIASVARGQLGTKRLQTDAITYLILNR